MAKWILNRPREHAFASEITVARYLKNLSDDWLICWGFFYRDNQDTQREGDFLILGPVGGLLVLEVKGGIPRHFPPTGNWEDHGRDNPVTQLLAEWGGVLRRLENTAFGAEKVFIAKALCYPDSDVAADEQRWHGLERSDILSGNELANGRLFRKAWIRFFTPAQDRNHKLVVSERARDAFLEVYGHGRDAEALREFLDHNDERFMQQIIAEYALLDMLANNRQLLVEGGPGSGKSWYAMEQARRYATAGMRVLFLVYNRAITEVFRRNFQGERCPTTPEGCPAVSVMNYEELAALILGVALDTLHPPADADRDAVSEFYDITLPARVLDAMRDPSRCAALPKYDALVVDEGQDHDTTLPSELAKRYPDAACGWWSIYWRMLKEETNAPMAIFYDEAQRPSFRRPGGFQPSRLRPMLSQAALVTLDRSLRYTRPVFEFLQSLEGDGTDALVAALGDGKSPPEGPEVELHDAQNTQDALREQIGSIIKRWQDEGYCQPCEVLILHSSSQMKDSALGAATQVGPFPLRDQEITHQRAVHHNSIHKAKGLDSRAVIVVGVPHPESADLDAYWRFTLFMGASRARQLLAVVSAPVIAPDTTTA